MNKERSAAGVRLILTNVFGLVIIVDVVGRVGVGDTDDNSLGGVLYLLPALSRFDPTPTHG